MYDGTYRRGIGGGMGATFSELPYEAYRSEEMMEEGHGIAEELYPEAGFQH